MNWETQFTSWPTTQSRDSARHRSAKLSHEIVAEIRFLRETEQLSYRELSRHVLTKWGIRISRQAIERAVQGYTWKAVTTPDNGAE